MAAETVSFTRMQDGTREDYALLARHEAVFAAGTADRLLAHVRRLDDGLGGYKLSRLQHSLQCATRAWRDGADVDWIVAALLHDIGDDLAPHNHDSLAAAVIEPYVREEVSWVIQHHGIFQMFHPGFPIWIRPTRPKAAGTLAKPWIPSFTRRVR